MATAVTTMAAKTKEVERAASEEVTSAAVHDAGQLTNQPTNKNNNASRLRLFIGQPRTHGHLRVRTTAPTPRKLPITPNPPFLTRQESLPSYILPKKSLPPCHAKRASFPRNKKKPPVVTTPRTPLLLRRQKKSLFLRRQESLLSYYAKKTSSRTGLRTYTGRAR